MRSDMMWKDTMIQAFRQILEDSPTKQERVSQEQFAKTQCVLNYLDISWCILMAGYTQIEQMH